MNKLNVVLAMAVLSITSLTANTVAAEEIQAEIKLELSKSMKIMMEETKKSLEKELMLNLEKISIKNLEITKPKIENKYFAALLK